MKTNQKSQPSEDLLDNTAFLVMDVGRLLRLQTDFKMRRLGLSRSEWWLLAHLWFFDGSTQQALADILDITKGGMTKLVDRLERKHLIARHTTTSDGRATKCIHLTPKGKLLAKKVNEATTEMVSEAEVLLKPVEVAKLHELLRRVRSVLLPSEEP